MPETRARHVVVDGVRAEGRRAAEDAGLAIGLNVESMRRGPASRQRLDGGPEPGRRHLGKMWLHLAPVYLDRVGKLVQGREVVDDGGVSVHLLVDVRAKGVVGRVVDDAGVQDPLTA